MPEYPKHYFYGPFETLEKAIDALRAYDDRLTYDEAAVPNPEYEAAKAYLVEYLDGETDHGRETIAILARDYLVDESIANGHGLHSVLALAEWLKSIGVDY